MSNNLQNDFDHDKHSNTTSSTYSQHPGDITSLPTSTSNQTRRLSQQLADLHGHSSNNSDDEFFSNLNISHFSHVNNHSKNDHYHSPEMIKKHLNPYRRNTHKRLDYYKPGKVIRNNLVGFKQIFGTIDPQQVKKNLGVIDPEDVVETYSNLESFEEINLRKLERMSIGGDGNDTEQTESDSNESFDEILKSIQTLREKEKNWEHERRKENMRQIVHKEALQKINRVVDDLIEFDTVEAVEVDASEGEAAFNRMPEPPALSQRKVKFADQSEAPMELDIESVAPKISSKASKKAKSKGKSKTKKDKKLKEKEKDKKTKKKDKAKKEIISLELKTEAQERIADISEVEDAKKEEARLAARIAELSKLADEEDALEEAAEAAETGEELPVAEAEVPVNGEAIDDEGPEPKFGIQYDAERQICLGQPLKVGQKVWAVDFAYGKKFRKGKITKFTEPATYTVKFSPFHKQPGTQRLDIQVHRPKSLNKQNSKNKPSSMFITSFFPFLKQKKKVSVFEGIEQEDVVKVLEAILLDEDSVDEKGKDGRSALDAAVRKGNTEIVKVLLRYGATQVGEDFENTWKNASEDMRNLLSEFGWGRVGK